ncbi:Transmembrane protein [Heracleum sosnowskyi]|uniref:Transmembrane protein n=1 Tax=Heracleum sosnowskyi TaxID=360622 RepID=A0AAD8JDA3_9APIA|nr:Transmembrane protein [Heracleum sosnowskyi]KAK1401979.1 Transmembrane protein [Heracleum sosnowskyi]
MDTTTLTGTDDWLARDKIYHVIFCFSINVVVSLLASHSPYSSLRRRSIFLGSFLSLAAGAAKEIADQFGFFHSAGASSRDLLKQVKMKLRNRRWSDCESLGVINE